MSQVILLMRDRASTRPLRFLWGLSISIVGLAVVLQSVGSGLLAAWLQLESSAAQALQAALFAGGATGLGALGVLVSKRRANSQETFRFLALSAGAMFFGRDFVVTRARRTHDRRPGCVGCCFGRYRGVRSDGSA